MAAALETDLVHMHKFLLNQKEMVSEKVFNDLMAAQVKVFANRLEAAKLTAGEGANLSSVLMNGPWTHDHKRVLGEALANGMGGGQPAKQRRASQQMASFPCYLTDSDIEQLQRDCHSLVKVETLVQRCVSLGLHLPSTSAVKHIVSTAVDCAPDCLICVHFLPWSFHFTEHTRVECVVCLILRWIGCTLREGQA